MPCKCQERDQRDTPRSHADNPTTPRTPCLYCAEKHISTAAALAREQGYAGANRGYILGELVAACWHLYGAGPDAHLLSDRLRDFRHRIQGRQEDETLTDFSPYLLAIDVLIRQAEQPSTEGGSL